MSLPFVELPFHIEPNEIPDPIVEMISYFGNDPNFLGDTELQKLLNKYLGIYLRKIYAYIYKTSITTTTTTIPTSYSDWSTVLDEYGNTLLHHFVMDGYYDLAEYALTKMGINPNVFNYGEDHDTNGDDLGQTPLMCIIEELWQEEYKDKYLDMCEMLVRNGADWTQICISAFQTFDGHFILDKFNKEIRKNVYDENIDKNVIALLEVLKRKNYIDLNEKCVFYTRKRFGRRTDPEGFGDKFGYHRIIQLKYSDYKNVNFNAKPHLAGKPIIYLAIITNSTKIVNWLIKNGADLDEYPVYKQNRYMNGYYQKIKKEYNFQKRKDILLLMEENIDNKYLNFPYEFREILSYI